MSVGGPIHGVIMHDHRNRIRTQGDIDFNSISAEIKRLMYGD
jgi:hypothetical protein